MTGKKSAELQARDDASDCDITAGISRRRREREDEHDREKEGEELVFRVRDPQAVMHTPSDRKREGSERGTLD